MAYLDQYGAATQGELRQRVVVASLLVSRDVFQEVDTTTNHANRVALAQRVLLNPDGWAHRFAVVMTAVLVVTAATTDADLKTAVGQVWNFFADAVAAGAG